MQYAAGAELTARYKGAHEPTAEQTVNPPDVRLTAWVHGKVQGVGFRWWTRAHALELGLTGYAANRPDGRVLVVARGPRDACQRLLDLLQSGTTPGRVDTVIADWADAGEPIRGFSEQ